MFSTQRNISVNRPLNLSTLPVASERVGEGGLRFQGKFKEMLPEKPLISIITVVLNGKEYLEDTILSVLYQTYQNVEYIIIDGGSADGTLDIIRKYEDAIDYWVSEPDEGIADAFNKGISLSTGEWVGIINADDYYLADTLNRIHTLQDAEVICGRLKFVETDDRFFELPAKPEFLPRFMSVNHPTVFIKRSIYNEYGLFDTSLKIAMDYELLLRLWQNNAVFEVIDETVSVMRMGGISDRLYRKSLWEVYLSKRKNGYPFLSSCLLYVGQFGRSITLTLLKKAGLGSIVEQYHRHCIKVKREYQ